MPHKTFCAEQVTKSIKNRTLVRDCSLHVKRGEVVGILGPNGAGKTTLFSILTGLIKLDTGRVFLDQENISHLGAHQRARLGIGYLPQEPSIFRGLTVEENILAVLEIFIKDNDYRQQRLEQLIVEFQLESVRFHAAITLSGGERRRTEIARAIAAQPSFILLDEPLAGIDPIAIQGVRSLIWHLKEQGIGVLITDHNVRETLSIVDRAYILYDGQIFMEGSPEEIINNEIVRRIYLGESFSL